MIRIARTTGAVATALMLGAGAHFAHHDRCRRAGERRQGLAGRRRTGRERVEVRP
ncbi:hypothetical protein [Rhodovibrio sodomensis]|uniref:hypothetical protein n=1 Tax=Rhodovibrio sodomensis TaxID=1088 RepID=UPI001907C544|nr:hypothetical protein [Rhodovibrio sodomensis]